MLKEILNDATEQDLKNFVSDFMTRLECVMPQAYEELMLELHKNVYGFHFSKGLALKAVSELEDSNENKGGKYSLEEACKIRRDYNISLNEYDFFYVLNVMYSDYSKLLNNDLVSYVKMVSLFLKVEDAPEGKALKYYLSMRKDL